MDVLKPKTIAVLAALAFLIAGAVYLIGQGGGNPDGAPAGSAAAALDAAARGEGANFTPKPAPVPVPDFSFEGASGEKLDLGHFRGKLVLLNLWATWCGPCREEMPELDRLQAELGSDRFEVVAISVDREGEALARDFLEKVGARSLGFYIDPTARANFTLGAFGLPTTLLISPQGEEIGRMVGPAPWASEDAKAFIEEALRLYAPSPNS